MGYKYLGITDRNNLYGALAFVKACQREQIHPVIGLLLEYYSQQTQKEHEIFLFAKKITKDTKSLCTYQAKK